MFALKCDKQSNIKKVPWDCIKNSKKLCVGEACKPTLYSGQTSQEITPMVV